MMNSNAILYDRVISDNGSGYVKLGYGGDGFPRFVIPSIVGKTELRKNTQIGDVQLKDIMIGDEAAPHRAYLNIKYPLSEGKVTDWDLMELLWNYCFDVKLQLQDKGSKKILLTEPAHNPKRNREKMG
jgi:actin-related protein 2